MKQQLEQRLQSLKTEFESGQKMLADLEAKQVNLRETLLRISGAIQVLEEELNKASEADDNGSQLVETVNAEVVTTSGDASL
jgi:chromosome segregation ATPase